MGSALNDPALLEHDNAVGVPYGRETVSDYKGRSALHQLIHALLNHSLRSGINGAGRLVENECRRIRDRRARNGEHLALTLAEISAVSLDNGVVAVGKLADKVVRVCELCRRDDFFICRVKSAVADILHDSVAEQVGLLQNYAERTAQIGLADLVDIDSVVADLAVLNVVKAVDKIRDSRLARAR